MNNRQVTKKYHVELKPAQKFLRDSLMELLVHYAGCVGAKDNYLWKIQARDGAGSVVTVTLYTSGNLICMGHGKLFDLTERLISLYHKSIPKH